jgi:transposase
MGLKRTDEFRRDAVRIALTSGLTRKQVADDLGVGMSTLNKWITAHRDTDVVSKEDLSLALLNVTQNRLGVVTEMMMGIASWSGANWLPVNVLPIWTFTKCAAENDVKRYHG